jgi:hypothetical protein
MLRGCLNKAELVRTRRNQRAGRRRYESVGSPFEAAESPDGDDRQDQCQQDGAVEQRCGDGFTIPGHGCAARRRPGGIDGSHVVKPSASIRLSWGLLHPAQCRDLQGRACAGNFTLDPGRQPDLRLAVDPNVIWSEVSRELSFGPSSVRGSRRHRHGWVCTGVPRVAATAGNRPRSPCQTHILCSRGALAGPLNGLSR